MSKSGAPKPAPLEVIAENVPERLRSSPGTSPSPNASGFSVEAILAALSIENERRCQPPLEEAQVRKVAESVGTYAPAARTGRPSRPTTVQAEVEV
jgi:hypothetical protein